MWRSSTSSSINGSPSAMRNAGDLKGTRLDGYANTRRTWTHVNADRDVELLGQPPVAIQPVVSGRHPEIRG